MFNLFPPRSSLMLVYLLLGELAGSRGRVVVDLVDLHRWGMGALLGESSLYLYWDQQMPIIL